METESKQTLLGWMNEFWEKIIHIRWQNKCRRSFLKKYKLNLNFFTITVNVLFLKEGMVIA